MDLPVRNGKTVGKLSSRPERSRDLVLRRSSSAEWRDPKGVSSTMLLKGVLPRLPVATARRIRVFARDANALFARPSWSRLKVTATIHGKNSL